VREYWISTIAAWHIHIGRGKTLTPTDTSERGLERLIVDLVTGKLDVREASAFLPDGAEEPESLDETDALTDAD
jgi:hypothetical protein